MKSLFQTLAALLLAIGLLGGVVTYASAQDAGTGGDIEQEQEAENETEQDVEQENENETDQSVENEIEIEQDADADAEQDNEAGDDCFVVSTEAGAVDCSATGGDVSADASNKASADGNNQNGSNTNSTTQGNEATQGNDTTQNQEQAGASSGGDDNVGGVEVDIDATNSIVVAVVAAILAALGLL